MPSFREYALDILRKLNDQADAQQLREMSRVVLNKLAAVVAERDNYWLRLETLDEKSARAENIADAIGRDFNIPLLSDVSVDAFDSVEILAGLVRGMAEVLKSEGIEWGAIALDRRPGAQNPPAPVFQGFYGEV